MSQITRTPSAPWNSTMSSANLDAANYIPNLYAKKVLFDFYASSVFNEVTNTDFQNDFKNQGDTITIRQAPKVATNSYTVGLGIDYEALTADSQDLVIDRALYQAFQVDDIDAVQTDIDLLNMYTTDASERLNIEVDIDVLSVMGLGADDANKGATAGAISGEIDLGVLTDAGNISITSTNALDKIVHCSQALSEQNITGDRFIIIPEWYASRLKLSDLKQADFTGDSTGVIRTGLIGMINGMKVYVNNNLPTSTPTAELTYTVIAGTKMASTFALQVSKTDTLKNPDSFGEFWRTLYVYGRKVVRPEGIVNMYCAPA